MFDDIIGKSKEDKDKKKMWGANPQWPALSKKIKPKEEKSEPMKIKWSTADELYGKKTLFEKGFYYAPYIPLYKCGW